MDDVTRAQARGLLRQATAARGGGIVGDEAVGALLGCSRSLVSVLRRGAAYGAPTDHWLARALEQFGGVRCPLEGRAIAIGDCQARQAQPAPTHNPLAMMGWRTCRQCATRNAAP